MVRINCWPYSAAKEPLAATTAQRSVSPGNRWRICGRMHGESWAWPSSPRTSGPWCGAGLELGRNALLTSLSTGLVQQRPGPAGKVAALVPRTSSARFGAKTPDTRTPTRSLSRSNFQKFILGREILQQPKLLVAAHPTWGVDVGAAATIHHALIAFRNAGAAILVISEDLDELFQISDRLGALCSGRLSPLKATVDTRLIDVGGWMAGQFDAPQSPALATL